MLDKKQQMIEAAKLPAEQASAFNPGVFWQGMVAFYNDLDYENDCPYTGVKAVYWYAGYLHAEEVFAESLL